MELEPWEALDVDDSDLSAFLRPCNRHHSHSHSNSHSQTLIPPDPRPLIPGPAGAVQAAMMHRRAHTSLEDPLPTQEFIRRVVQHGHESDHDFTTNAWLSAFHFLRSQGLLDADSEPPATPLNSIRNLVNVRRVAQVVAVIKSCTPNGFGDMMVTLKDPTGTISASVHHKVFSEGQFGKDISVGSVLVLQKVAVFSPTRSSCYLNITLGNIVKVFSKDSEPPSERIDPALSVGQITPDTERQQVSRMLGNAFFLPQERTEGIMTNSRLDSRSRVVVTDVDKQKVDNLGLGVTRAHPGNKSTVLVKENLSLRQDNIAGPEEVSNEIEMDGQPKHPKFGGRGTSSSADTVDNDRESQREVSNAVSSIPQWTDEQLDELLAFD